MAERSLAVEAQSVGLPVVLNALLNGPVHRLQIKDIVEQQLHPDEALREQLATGVEKWWNYVAWGSTTMSKVGWITKDGSGNWSITKSGRSAVAKLTDPDALRREANRLYAEWRKSTLPPTRRAWLIRGSSVRGANLVHQWLAEGWCSLAASQCRRSRNPPGGCSSYPAVGSGVFLVDRVVVALTGVGGCCCGRRVDR